MIEPFYQVFNNKYSILPIAVNTKDFKLEIYKYEYNIDNKEIEIFEFNNISKNPIYGIYKLWNLESLFRNKKILLYNFKKKVVNKNNFQRINNFFKKIIVNDFKVDFNLHHNYDTYITNADLDFYNEKNKEYVLSFHNIEKNYLIDLFLNSYNDNLNKLLIKLYEKYKVRIYIFSEANVLNIKIYKSSIILFEINILQNDFYLDNILNFFNNYKKYNFLKDLKYKFSSLTYPKDLTFDFLLKNKEQIFYKERLL